MSSFSLTGGQESITLRATLSSGWDKSHYRAIALTESYYGSSCPNTSFRNVFASTAPSASSGGSTSMSKTFTGIDAGTYDLYCYAQQASDPYTWWLVGDDSIRVRVTAPTSYYTLEVIANGVTVKVDGVTITNGHYHDFSMAYGDAAQIESVSLAAGYTYPIWHYGLDGVTKYNLYNADGSRNTDPDAWTLDVRGDRVVHIYATERTAYTITRRYYRTGTTSQIYSTQYDTVYAGDTYDPDDYWLAIGGYTGNYSSPSSPFTVTGNRTVTYYYDRDVFVLTCNYYLTGTATKIFNTVTHNIEQGSTVDPYDYVLELSAYDFNFVSPSSPFTMNSAKTINVFYDYASRTLTVHHYVAGTTTQVRSDTTYTLSHGGTVIPANYFENVSGYHPSTTDPASSFTINTDRTIICYYLANMGLFSWTNNDSVNIVAGNNPTDHMSASVWNNSFRAKIRTLIAWAGLSNNTVTVTAGTRMRAAEFNSAQMDLASLATSLGTTQPPSPVIDNQAQTTQQILGLKSSLNSAINAYNNR